MSDYISRQAAIDELHKGIFDFFDFCDDDEESPMTYMDERLLEINKAISKRLKQLPSAPVREVRRGKWIHDGYDMPHGIDWMHCSECGRREPYVPAAMTDYCPTCGADMKGERDDN